MRIERKQILFGQPAIKIREVMRRAIAGHLWGYSQNEIVDKVAAILKQPVAVAEQVIADLIQANYLLVEQESGQKLRYKLVDTETGRRLGMASAISLSREKATILINEVIARAETINANNELAYYVERLCVFGSYLSDKEILGDLDMGYKLMRRYEGDDFIAISEKRSRLARSTGKNFRDFLEELFWSELEISKMLKNRRRGLSLRNIDSDSVFTLTETKIVYQYNKD